MALPTPLVLKKQLVSQGFEVYRTLGQRIVLADRVRDNLIMDSGVSALTGESLGVRLAVRSQAADFTGESEESLVERARGLGAVALACGYRETEVVVTPIQDPGDRSRNLDTWYEVIFERTVESLDELFDELRHAVTFEKIVLPRPRG